jgi:hypothetical protein
VQRENTLESVMINMAHVQTKEAAMNMPLTLSVVIMKESYQQKSLWVAQCLEYDIAAQGDTIQQALKALDVAVVAQLTVYLKNNQNPLEMLPRAPKEYWNMYSQGEALRDPLPIRPPENVPPAWMIPSITAQNLRVC